MEYDPLDDDPQRSAAAPQAPLHEDPPAEEEAPPATRRRRRGLFRFVVLPLATLLMAAFTGVIVGASIKRPEVEALADFTPRLVTELHDRQGRVFRQYAREHRILLDETEVPELLRNAIIAAEDANFYIHGGIDLKGIVRAAWTNLREGGKREGASTITMQLARQLFLSRDKKWTRKIEEAFLSVELEKRYSKQQILTFYANLVNLGGGNYGMEAAAQNYFGKSVAELSLVEAATLAGIPQRPSAHNVYLRPEVVKKRRNHVLGRMLAEKMIGQEEYERAIAEPLLVIPKRRESTLGSYFAEEIRRDLQESFGTSALYDRGLQVHTTLDRDIQRATETALREGLLRLDHRKGWRGPREHIADGDLEERELPSWSEPAVPGEWREGIVLESTATAARVKIADTIHDLGRAGIAWTRRARPDEVLKRGDVAWFRLAESDGESVLHLEQEPQIEGAAVVIEAATGAVRAMVGGWDYDRNEFNRVTQAERQVGSAFKPFVFGAALESGFTAADTLFDAPVVFLGADNTPSYSPRNYYRRYDGIITLRETLEKSVNVPSVKLLDLVGVQQVIDFARRCGLRGELPPYPSLALGSADIRPLELAAAYGTFVNQGIHVEPYFVERVEGPDGRLLDEHLTRAQKATEPQIAYLLTSLLRGVALRGTAAGALARLPLDVAGKTGTTNDYTDAWFVGFTPRLVILTWVGYDKKRSLGRGMTGADAALPIWVDIVERGLEEGWIQSGERFSRPPGIVEVAIDRKTGFLASDASARVLSEVFVEGTEPEQVFDARWGRIIELPWYQQEPFYIPKEGERMPGEIVDWDLVRQAWADKG